MRRLICIWTLGLACLVLAAACKEKAAKPPPSEPPRTEGSAAPPPPPPPAPSVVVVATPARAGAVDGTSQNSDEFIWRLFTEFAAPISANPTPVLFETWASDADTFSKTPAWPEPARPKRLQQSRLRLSRAHTKGPVDVACNAPGNAAVGNFPTTGTPAPCIAEEVKRNRPMFDYILNNKLNTQEGLKAAYQASLTVDMPVPSISVKGDWVPVQTMVQWIPSLGSVEGVRKLYYTNTSEGVEYALVSLHVSSRQNPNWVWGTFEHQLTPGRCDDLGCADSFGARVPLVPPARNAVNTSYGPCEKSPALKALMEQKKLSPVWDNFCLKATQVDYVAKDGTPYALGNSVIERIVGNGTVAASSCIGCHSYASFDASGAPAKGVIAMLPYNPMGPPIAGVLTGSRTFSFQWGLLNAP